MEVVFAMLERATALRRELRKRAEDTPDLELDLEELETLEMM